MKFGSSIHRAVPAALALFLLTCGGSTPTTPPTPTPPPTTQPPVTQPTPPPVNALCLKLGYVNPNASRCNEGAPVFGGDVNAAIDRLIQQHPEYFANGPGGTQIRNVGAYYVGVINNLDTAGFCAGFDGEELQIKNSNDFNEQFDISSSSGYVRRDAYRATCTPAAFPPQPPGDIPPPAGCNLPSSHEVACGSADIQFLNQMQTAINLVVQQHPELFDKGDTSRGVDDGYKVLDPNKYLELVVAAFAQQAGFCARFDGEEVVLKNTNDFSEHYDILTGDNHIRRGQGEYRTSCYPAAF